MIREGKTTKEPINARTGNLASTSNPETWCAFETAIQRSESWDGIGFVFTEADPFVGIDLDGCRDLESGQIEEWARVLIESFDTYTEVSPSGSGVKLFGRGSLSAAAWHKINLRNAPSHGGKQAAIEVYDRGRFFTVTGDALESSSTEVVTVQEALDALEASYARPKAMAAPRPAVALEIDDH
ncbi:MAG: hypothetical protein H0U60_13155, partial [Blastocatellia bacterium]|nr:hypothetical protein [Blastocatellia bacterium]